MNRYNINHFSSENYLRWDFSDPSLMPNRIEEEMKEFELWIIWQGYIWNKISFMFNDNIYYNMRLFRYIVQKSVYRFNTLVKLIIKEGNITEQDAKKLAWKILGEE